MDTVTIVNMFDCLAGHHRGQTGNIVGSEKLVCAQLLAETGGNYMSQLVGVVGIG